ncbi:MAG: ABC transporter ATP-binding protein [Nitrososphaeria archaeon]|nr:ABC transporter ATP-binding protein [Nitrososphaeria archaeon]
MISVKKLSFSYGNLQVLKDISFDLFYGEFVGVIGPNGSGKTTLLKCLCRLLKPIGAIYIDGEELSRIDLNTLSRKFSYISSELDSSMDELTVFEIASSGRTPYMKSIWWESREDERIILESIKIVGLSNLVNRKLKNLSSGEKQMARIARVLSQTPRILLVDEPTVHLDLKHQVEIMSILKNMAKNGALVVAVFHDLNLASIYSDRMIILKNGEIVSSGKPDDVLTEEVLQKVYDVDVKVVKDHEHNMLVILPAIPARV